MKIILSSLTLFSATILPAFSAGLILSVDSIANVVTLTGSDSGTPGTADVVRWDAGTPAFPKGTSIELAATVDQSGLLQEIEIWTGGIRLAFRGPAFSTITATGTPISYDTLNATDEATFESFIGQSFSLATGSGYESTVDIVAVPEPSSFALVLGGLLWGFCHRRRK